MSTRSSRIVGRNRFDHPCRSRGSRPGTFLREIASLLDRKQATKLRKLLASDRPNFDSVALECKFENVSLANSETVPDFFRDGNLSFRRQSCSRHRRASLRPAGSLLWPLPYMVARQTRARVRRIGIVQMATSPPQRTSPSRGWPHSFRTSFAREASTALLRSLKIHHKNQATEGRPSRDLTWAGSDVKHSWGTTPRRLKTSSMSNMV